MIHLKYMGCVYLCLSQLLHGTCYASATSPAPSSGYKDIYLEAPPGSEIDVFIPLLARNGDNVRNYVQVIKQSDKSKLEKLKNENLVDQEKMEKSDSTPNKAFSERFLFLKNHPPLPHHPPTRHHPPRHPLRPPHGPRKHPPRPHHGPPPFHFEHHPHFDHGLNTIFDPPYGFNFDPPPFMNEESDFPYIEEFFEEQYFNPEPPNPDSFRFPSDEHDRPPPHHLPPHPPPHPLSHPPPYPPPHPSPYIPDLPSHINYITEENIYRGDIPFKETHNDRDRIRPGLVPAGVKGLDPGLVALISNSAHNLMK